MSSSSPLAEQSPLALTVATLTLDEKILLVEGVDSWHTHAIPRVGVASITLTDGPHGVRMVRENSGAFGLAAAVPATSFPTTATVANTWSEQRARELGEALGRQSRERGVHVLLAPGINIKRNPLCGRNFEYFSEDPLLTGRLGAAVVRGIESQGVASSLKHFAANSSENYRFVGDSVVDERALREIYLRAFEHIVTTARPATVMAAYNQLNGVYCSENRRLLTDILRGEWGFDGVVMTDWGATRDRALSLRAGCDLDMPGEVAHNRTRLRESLHDGTLSDTDLDESVARILALVDRVRRDPVDSSASPASSPSPTDDDLALTIAREGAVLLQNDGVLPLDTQLDNLVIMGEPFERMRYQGAGSSLVNPTTLTTPREAFDRRDLAYRFVVGYRSLDREFDPALAAEALTNVNESSTVLFFGGLSDLDESEGFDRESMALPPHQLAVLDRLLDTGARVILVLFGGAPVEVSRAEEYAAVLAMYLPGMHGGEACAQLLFGEASPTGRLAESWPLAVTDASSAADFNRAATALYAESIYVGYRFYDAARVAVRYPFGHGLSYADVTYRSLEVRRDGADIVVAVELQNTSQWNTDEIVQVYVRNPRGPVFMAEKELRGFARVSVEAGATVTAEVRFAERDLAFWHVTRHDWALLGGAYDVQVGASSRDIRLRSTITVVGDSTLLTSPYSAQVEEAYAVPPRGVPASFSELANHPLADDGPARRFDLDTRLQDARRTFVGGLLYRAIVGRLHRQYCRARALPPSAERDAQLKSAYFLWRMMPNMSLRGMVMASSGRLPISVATGIVALARGRVIRALGLFIRRPLGQEAVR